MTAAGDLDEPLHPQLSLLLRDAQLLAERQSAYQRIEVFASPLFGRFFRLDGVLMSTEADEFYYHENLVHPAAVAHPGLANALVIGGGDGGSARQLLKYRSLQRLNVAELDPVVVELAQQYLPGIHQGSFADPRLALHIGDGREFLLAAQRQYDLIVLDLTDPVGAAAPLYTPQFFAECRTRLSAAGALSLHLGSPVYQLQQVRTLYRHLKQAFAQVRLMLVPIPSYGGLWALALATNGADPAGFDAIRIKQRLSERGISGLSYYNGAMHQALFAMPEFLRTALAC